MMNQTSGYLAFSQSKIDLFNEANHELTPEEIQEAIQLSGYTKQDKNFKATNTDSTRCKSFIVCRIYKWNSKSRLG